MPSSRTWNALQGPETVGTLTLRQSLSHRQVGLHPMNRDQPEAYPTYSSGLYRNDARSGELSSLEAPDEV